MLHKIKDYKTKIDYIFRSFVWQYTRHGVAFFLFSGQADDKL